MVNMEILAYLFATYSYSHSLCKQHLNIPIATHSHWAEWELLNLACLFLFKSHSCCICCVFCICCVYMFCICCVCFAWHNRWKTHTQQIGIGMPSSACSFLFGQQEWDLNRNRCAKFSTLIRIWSNSSENRNWMQMCLQYVYTRIGIGCGQE